MYSRIKRTFFAWNMACISPAAYTRNIAHAKICPSGYHRISVIQSNRKCHWAMGESRALSAKPGHYHVLIDELPYSDEEGFLGFWTIKLTIIKCAGKNQYFVVDWSRRVSSPVKSQLTCGLFLHYPWFSVYG